MSSVLKRLRAVAEMREADMTDRGRFRRAKHLMQQPKRVTRMFEPPKDSSHSLIERFSKAKKEMAGGLTLPALARALKVVWG